MLFSSSLGTGNHRLSPRECFWLMHIEITLHDIVKALKEGRTLSKESCGVQKRVKSIAIIAAPVAEPLIMLEEEAPLLGVLVGAD